MEILAWHSHLFGKTPLFKCLNLAPLGFGLNKLVFPHVLEQLKSPGF